MGIRKKSLAVLICILMLCGIAGIGASAAALKEGTYTGVYERVSMSGVGIRYEISAAFADGQYSYDVRVQLLNGEYDGQDSTKFGTYTISGDTLTMTGGNLTSAVVGADGSLTVSGTLSSFAFAPADITLTWVSSEKPKDPDHPNQPSQPIVYPITEGGMQNRPAGSSEVCRVVCAGAFEKLTEVRADGVLLSADRYLAAEQNGGTAVSFSALFLQTLPVGRHRFVLTFADGVSETAVLRIAEPDGTFSDSLQSGKYLLTNDSFIEGVGVHRHPSVISIDRSAETFRICDADETAELRGAGALSFDSGTGAYTMSYTAGGPETQTDNTSEFVVVNGNIRFTTPMKLGRSMMNTRDEDGRFLSYDAVYVDYDPVLHETNVIVPESKTVRVRDMFPVVENITFGGAYRVQVQSSDPKVVSVDAAGTATAHKRGTTVLTVTVKDTNGNSVEKVCTVTVRYVWWQWLIRIFLFGWIWY